MLSLTLEDGERHAHRGERRAVANPVEIRVLVRVVHRPGLGWVGGGIRGCGAGEAPSPGRPASERARRYIRASHSASDRTVGGALERRGSPEGRRRESSKRHARARVSVFGCTLPKHSAPRGGTSKS